MAIFTASASDANAPAGFVYRELQSFEKDEVVYTRLLIPQCPALSEFLDARDESVARQSRDQAEIRRQRDQRLWTAADEKATKDREDRLRKGRQDAGDFSIQDERNALDQLYKSQLLASIEARARDSRGHVTKVAVYEWDQPLNLVKDLTHSIADRDFATRYKELYKKLKSKGNFRSLAWPALQARDALDELRGSHPHFQPVIELVQDRLALADSQRLPPILPPVLLVGPPGIGKTDFSQALADALKAPIRRHSFDVATTDSALLGADKRWSNTTHGLVFDLVCLGRFANPVVLLDEIDKFVVGYQNDPVAPLHSLLEPITSKAIRDISVDLEFDASHVTWIATANDARKVPSTLRSRFIEFEIAPPTAEQALQIAESVARSVHKKVGGSHRFEIPTPRIAALVAHLTPREQVRALEAGFARAAVNGRYEIRRGDLPADVLVDDVQNEGGRRRKPPEFLH